MLDACQSCTFGLLDLPNDLVLAILSYVDQATLCAVSQVSRSLNVIATANVLWRGRCFSRTVSPSFGQWDTELNRSPPWKKLYQIANKWKSEDGKEMRVVTFSSGMQMPWIQRQSGCQGDCLLVTEGSDVHSFLLNGIRKTRRRGSRKKIDELSCCGHTGDVVRFVANGDGLLATCSMDSTLRLWSLVGSKASCTAVLSGHRAGVYCVDAVGNCVVSGSKDHTVKIWRSDGASWECYSTVEIGDHVWSVLINPFYPRHFHVGTAAKSIGAAALQQFDVNSPTTPMHFSNPPSDPQKFGAGILQMQQVDGNVVLSCGYDATVRSWDGRVGQCVQTWEDPHDNSLYSLASNGNMAFATGACRYGTTFCIGGKSHNGRGSSPVYSLQMTYDKLFVGLSHCVSQLSFA